MHNHAQKEEKGKLLKAATLPFLYFIQTKIIMFWNFLALFQPPLSRSNLKTLLVKKFENQSLLSRNYGRTKKKQKQQFRKADL